MVRAPQKNCRKIEYITDSESENENENTPDNSDYEIEEEEQNIGKKNKQQNEIKNKKGKKTTLKIFDYLNNSSQDAKRNRQ